MALKLIAISQSPLRQRGKEVIHFLSIFSTIQPYSCLCSDCTGFLVRLETSYGRSCSL